MALITVSRDCSLISLGVMLGAPHCPRVEYSSSSALRRITSPAYLVPAGCRQRALGSFMATIKSRCRGGIERFNQVWRYRGRGGGWVPIWPLDGADMVDVIELIICQEFADVVGCRHFQWLGGREGVGRGLGGGFKVT